MSNNLTEEYKKGIHKEYLLRYFVVLAMFLLIVGVVAVLLLIPVFVSGRVAKVSVEEQLEQFQSEAIDDANETELSRTTEILDIFSGEREIGSLENILEAIIEARPSGVTLTSLTFKEVVRADQDTDEVRQLYTVTVSGMARTRNALIGFEESLDSKKHFSNVQLPVSNLARDRDIPYSLSVDALTQTESLY